MKAIIPLQPHPVYKALRLLLGSGLVGLLSSLFQSLY